jgi:chaperone modulatory protein CbpM
MQKEEMISASDFCIHHNIEPAFIDSLHQSGLIEITIIEKKVFVPLSQLHQLEKLARLYYEMDINVEGIETITYLLQRMNEMQQQLVRLTNRLNLYENE